jgi:hypothetical protein
MRVLLAGAFLFAGCVPPASTPTPSASSPPAAATATSSSVAVQASPAPTATFSVDPSAPWPVVLYEGEGFIVSRRTESAQTELARPCGPVSRLEARPAGLLTWCNTAGTDFAELRLISIPGGRVTVLASGTRASWPADVSPDGRSVAAFRAGECVPGPPVCQTRAVLIDVASRTEREILPSGYPLGATLDWNALGLTLFQPECAEAGCAGVGDKGGTFVWDGSAFKRWSDLRFVASSGEWMLLERLRSFGVEPRTVIVRGPQGDTTLSAGHALAINAAGEALVWEPGSGLLIRFAPDGRILWKAALGGAVVKTMGADALLVASPTNKLEIYDLKRMLRFAPAAPISYVVAGAAR